MTGLQDAWYHGSTLILSHLRKGSTITQDRHLAEVFSHKPTIVSCAHDSMIRHNGTLPGYLYKIAEPVKSEDIFPVPFSSMEPGKEWRTQRELQVAFLNPVEIKAEEFLSDDEIDKIKKKINRKE
jgi:hypothetical protein